MQAASPAARSERDANGGLGRTLAAMSADRRVAIALVLLALVAWTAYIFFWLGTMGVPSIEGAAEEAERIRLAILVIWLVGLAIGATALVGLGRGTFDAVPRSRRVRLAIAGYAIGAAAVVALYWFNLAILLIFAWPALAAALLMLTAWASTADVRRRLGVALIGWLIGVTAVGAAWFVATHVMRELLWLGWGVVTLAAAAWWALALVRVRPA